MTYIFKKIIIPVLAAGCCIFSCKSVPSSVYEGTYLDADNNEPNLVITAREDGQYNVTVGVFRLTSLDDGLGFLTDKGLSFTATDAAGNPLGGIITLDADTATVTFTDSTWPLLENGASFTYTRQSKEDAILYRVRTIYDDVASIYNSSDTFAPAGVTALKDLYCSSEWKDLKSRISQLDEKNGEIGFFDSDYWIQGQDYGDVSISDLAVESLSTDRASILFTLHNLGYCRPMRIELVLEDGQWLIDDFICLDGPVYDWKQHMEEYLKTELL